MDDEPTVSDHLLLATAGEYDVPLNQSIYCAGIYLASSDYLYDSNGPTETMPHSPSQMSSTISFVPGEHPMSKPQLTGTRKKKTYVLRKFHAPNPLDHLYMSVQHSSGQVTLVEE